MRCGDVRCGEDGTWLLPRVMLWLSWNFCVSVLLNSKRAPSKMSGDRMPCASFFSSSSRGGQLLSSRLPCRGKRRCALSAEAGGAEGGRELVTSGQLRTNTDSRNPVIGLSELGADDAAAAAATSTYGARVITGHPFMMDSRCAGEKKTRLLAFCAVLESRTTREQGQQGPAQAVSQYRGASAVSGIWDNTHFYYILF